MQYNPPYGISDPNAPYINGDPSIARQGSILPAEAAEFPQREIVNLIGYNNLTPSNNDLEQLTEAARRQFVNFCVDSGAANALSVALVPALTAYQQGLPLRVLVSNNNTGPSTINVNSLGNRQIRRSGGAQLIAGDLTAGMIAELVDDGTAFQMVNFLGAVGGGTTNNYTIHIPYAEDTSTIPNQIIASYSPAITTAVAGDVVVVKVKNANTGAMTFAPNAMSPMPVLRNDGQPLQARDVGAGEALIMEYNTTFWQMLRLVRSQVYFKLTADLTLYVRPDGSDTNDGSLNDPGHAFKTIQGAIDYVRNSFLIAGRTVTIQLGVAGTYFPDTTLHGGSIQILNMPGSIVIRGDPANKIGYVIAGPTGAFSSIAMSGSGVNVTISGVTLQWRVTTNYAIECDYGASCAVTDVGFTGPSIGGGIVCIACTAGFVTVSNNIDIWNNCGGFCAAGAGGSVQAGLWYTLITCHGNAWGTAFCFCFDAYIQFTYGWTTFAGGASGMRYLATLNGIINTGSGGPNYLPGNVPGVVDASSVYA